MTLVTDAGVYKQNGVRLDLTFGIIPEREDGRRHSNLTYQAEN